MKQKVEAFAKYVADFLRTVGIALILFSGIGIMFERAEAMANLAQAVTIGILGFVFVVAGGVLVLISTIDKES